MAGGWGDWGPLGLPSWFWQGRGMFQLFSEDSSTAAQYYLTPVRMAALKTKTKAQKLMSVDEDMEKLSPWSAAGRNLKRFICHGRQRGGVSES